MFGSRLGVANDPPLRLTCPTRRPGTSDRAAKENCHYTQILMVEASNQVSGPKQMHFLRPQTIMPASRPACAPWLSHRTNHRVNKLS